MTNGPIIEKALQSPRPKISRGNVTSAKERLSGVPNPAKIGSAVIVAIGVLWAGNALFGGGGISDAPYQHVVPAAEQPLKTTIGARNGNEQSVLVILPGGKLATPIGFQTVKLGLNICQNKPLPLDQAEMLRQADQVFAHGCTVEKTIPHPTDADGIDFDIPQRGITVTIIAGMLNGEKIPLSISAAVGNGK